MFEDFWEEEEDGEPELVYDLRFVTYSGMTIPLEDRMPLEDIRTTAAEYLRQERKSGNDVCTLERGKKWEIQTPENQEGFFVSDNDGILYVREGN